MHEKQIDQKPRTPVLALLQSSCPGMSTWKMIDMSQTPKTKSNQSKPWRLQIILLELKNPFHIIVIVLIEFLFLIAGNDKSLPSKPL